MTLHSRSSDLDRIELALRRAGRVAREYTPGSVAWADKKNNGRWDPVTEADSAIDALLKETLPLEGEGWLSEETRDSPVRLECARVWVVDPLDGTREFVQGIPEWCVSVGLVEDGEAVAGGILNPSTDQLILGSLETGVTLNGAPVADRGSVELSGARVLASRSEVGRGEWERYDTAVFDVVPCGSVAYKLGLVAVGLFEATWTLVPKHEWDVVGGAALVRAGGGVVLHADGSPPAFNRPNPKLPNLLAGPESLLNQFMREWL